MTLGPSVAAPGQPINTSPAQKNPKMFDQVLLCKYFSFRTIITSQECPCIRTFLVDEVLNKIDMYKETATNSKPMRAVLERHGFVLEDGLFVDKKKNEPLNKKVINSQLEWAFTFATDKTYEVKDCPYFKTKMDALERD